MPKYELSISGQKYEVEAPSESSLPEIAESISKKEGLKGADTDKYAKDLNAQFFGKVVKSLPFSKSFISAVQSRINQERSARGETGPLPYAFGEEPAAKGLSAQLAAGAGSAIPTLALANPFLKGAGALTKVPAFLRPALGFGAYEGTKALTQGEDPVGASLGGAGSALMFGAGSKLGASMVPRGVPFAETLGSILGAGGAGYAMAPKEEQVSSAILGGGFGAMSPSKRAPLSSFGKFGGQAFKSLAGIKPEVYSEVEQRGFRNVIQDKYLNKKMPEQIQERIDQNLDQLEKGAIGKFEEATDPLRGTKIDWAGIRGEVVKAYNKVKNNPFKGDSVQLNDRIAQGIVNTEAKNLGDVLDMRRFLADELYTSGRQGVKSKFGKDVYDIFNKYLHTNETLKKADAEWTTLQEVLREGKKLTGETGEKFLERFSKLTSKQKESLASLEKEVGGEPFIEDLTNWSLAQEFATKPMAFSLNPFSGFGQLQKIVRPTLRGYLRGSEVIGKGMDIGQEALNIGSERLRSGLERSLQSERGSVPIPGFPEKLPRFSNKIVDDTSEAILNKNKMFSEVPKFRPGGFKSEVYDLIESSSQNVWDANQLRGFLKGKVRQTELDALGISNLQGKVGKKDILDLVKSKIPQVEEVVKGGENISQGRLEELSSFADRRDLTISENREYDILRQMENEGKLTDTTKFSQYQLPGGENYREVLIKVPEVKKPTSILSELPKSYRVEKQSDGSYWVLDSDQTMVGVGRTTTSAKKDALNYINQNLFNEEKGIEGVRISNPNILFKSSHWDEPNVLAHLRLNDRITPDGKKVLFVEELQSDWAKEGRKGGMEDPANDARINAWALENYKKPFDELSQTARNQILTDLKIEARVPYHPLLKNWQELALKRALKEAVDKNYDYISWTTGEQQAERYDLSKKLNGVEYTRSKRDGSYRLIMINKNGNVERGIENVLPEDLPKFVGKELGQKITSNESPNHTYSGLDLKIGGEWAKNLYDRQVPNILKNLTKGELKEIELGSKKHSTQLAIKITPEIKAKVKAGLPLFSSLLLPASQREDKSPYDRIKQAETGSEEDPWIRTKAKGTGSSAFGEVQITKGLVDTVLKNPKKYKLDTEDIGFLNWLSQQQAKMLRYGGKDMKPGFERYDYGQKGDWNDSLIPKYRKAVGKILQNMSEQHGKRFWRVWRYGEKGSLDQFKQDKRYEKEFNK